jgi:ABC-type antimicrobial peptide transport system permease subunit
MLGIVIGVAGVIAMSSFSLGSKKKQADQIRALGANLVRIVDDRLEGEKLTRARTAGSRGLSLADMETIGAQVPGVRKIAAMREAKLNIVHDGPELSPRILGVAGDYDAVNNISVESGRPLDARDAAACARVAVVGDAIARKIGPASPVGSRILLGGTPFTIVGVLANRKIDIRGLEASGVADANYDLLVPLSTILFRTRHVDQRSEIDEIHVQLDSEDRLYDAGTAARRLLEAAHGGLTDFQLVVPLDLLKQKQQSQKLLDVLTICISSIALIVGGIGIMNIMLASVTERIREIGVRRAVGATENDILLQFLSEAVIISVFGGLIGILLAVAVVAVACAALSLPFVVSTPMVLLAIAASTLTGVVFGLYPARVAARKNPVEALRYE